MKRSRTRVAITSALTASAVLLVTLGPARPVFASAAATVYAAAVYLRYLFLSVPGVFWWTIASVAVSILLARKAVRGLRETTDVAVLYRVRQTLQRGRRRPGTCAGNRVQELRRLFLDIDEHVTARAAIERELVDLTSRRVTGRPWTRTAAAGIAEAPALADRPELQTLVRRGPDYGSPGRRRRRSTYGRSASDTIERAITELETLSTHEDTT